VWEAFLEGFCAYHHAQYPSALTTAFFLDHQSRRFQPNRGTAGKDSGGCPNACARDPGD
jgi:hypothetical protein